MVSIPLIPTFSTVNVHSDLDTEDFTPAEVARRLRVDYTTVIRWIRTGLLDVETIQEGRRNRHHIKKSVVEAIERRDDVMLDE